MNTYKNNFSKFLLLLFFSVYYAYQFIYRIITNIISDYLINKYYIQYESISQFASVWYIGYVLSHIPIAILLELISIKKIMFFSMIINILGFIPLLYLDDFFFSVLGRFFIGLGSSASSLGAFKVFLFLFNKKKFPIMLSIMTFFGLLTASFFTNFSEVFINTFGWMKTMNILIILGIIISFISLVIIPKKKNNKVFSISEVKFNFKYILDNPIIILISIAGGLMIGPLEGFADAWSNQYLYSIYNIKNNISSNVTQIIYCGMSFGLIIYGKIIEKNKSYYNLLIINAIIMLIFFSFIISKVIININLLKLFYFIMGFSCSYQIIVINKNISIAKTKHKVFVSSITNMIMMFFGWFYHQSIGKMLKFNMLYFNCKTYYFFYSLIIINIGIFFSILIFIILNNIKNK